MNRGRGPIVRRQGNEEGREVLVEERVLQTPHPEIQNPPALVGAPFFRPPSLSLAKWRLACLASSGQSGPLTGCCGKWCNTVDVWQGGKVNVTAWMSGECRNCVARAAGCCSLCLLEIVCSLDCSSSFSHNSSPRRRPRLQNLDSVTPLLALSAYRATLALSLAAVAPSPVILPAIKRYLLDDGASSSPRLRCSSPPSPINRPSDGKAPAARYPLIGAPYTPFTSLPRIQT